MFKTLFLGLRDMFRHFFTRRRLIALGIILALAGVIYIIVAKPFDNTRSNLRIETLQDRGAINIGIRMDVMPFAYTDENNDLAGFEVDLAHIIAERLLGSADRAEFIQVSAMTALPSLDKELCDISLAQIYATSEREERYVFSTPYYTDAIAVMVPKNTLQSLQDLDGKRIAYLNDSPVQTDLEAFFDEYDYICELAPYASYPEIIQAMQLGKVDAFCAEMAVLTRYLDDKHTILQNYVATLDYGIALLKSNTTLQQAIDGIILELQQSGELEALAKKWKLGIYQ